MVLHNSWGWWDKEIQRVDHFDISYIGEIPVASSSSLPQRVKGGVLVNKRDLKPPQKELRKGTKTAQSNVLCMTCFLKCLFLTDSSCSSTWVSALEQDESSRKKICIYRIEHNFDSISCNSQGSICNWRGNEQDNQSFGDKTQVLTYGLW